MLTRFHKILIGLLAVQLALAIYTTTRGGPSAPTKEKPLLAGYDAAKVTRLQVTGTGAAKPIDLVKQGDAWVVASQFGFPADASKVSDALGALGRMAAADPIATRAGRHAQLGVGDAEPTRKLIVTADGKDTTIILGNNAGPRRTAVRLGGDKVYAVAGVSAYTYGLDAAAWIDTHIVKVPRDEVAKVTIDKGGKKLELERAPAPPAPPAEPGAPPPPPPPPTWTVKLDGAAPTLAAGERVEPETLQRLVDHATMMLLVEPADPQKAVPAPLATITIDRTATGAATPAPVVIDVVADGERYWVHERGTSKAALVDKVALDDVLAVDRATVVAAAPKPGAAPADPPLQLPSPEELQLPPMPPP